MSRDQWWPDKATHREPASTAMTSTNRESTLNTLEANVMGLRVGLATTAKASGSEGVPFILLSVGLSQLLTSIKASGSENRIKEIVAKADEIFDPKALQHVATRKASQNGETNFELRETEADISEFKSWLEGSLNRTWKTLEQLRSLAPVSEDKPQGNSDAGL